MPLSRIGEASDEDEPDDRQDQPSPEPLPSKRASTDSTDGPQPVPRLKRRIPKLKTVAKVVAASRKFAVLSESEENYHNAAFDFFDLKFEERPRRPSANEQSLLIGKPFQMAAAKDLPAPRIAEVEEESSPEPSDTESEDLELEGLSFGISAAPPPGQKKKQTSINDADEDDDEAEIGQGQGEGQDLDSAGGEAGGNCDGSTAPGQGADGDGTFTGEGDGTEGRTGSVAGDGSDPSSDPSGAEAGSYPLGARGRLKGTGSGDSDAGSAGRAGSGGLGTRIASQRTGSGVGEGGPGRYGEEAPGSAGLDRQIDLDASGGVSGSKPALKSKKGNKYKNAKGSNLSRRMSKTGSAENSYYDVETDGPIHPTVSPRARVWAVVVFARF